MSENNHKPVFPVMLNSSININQTNSHMSPQIIEHNNDNDIR